MKVKLSEHWVTVHFDFVKMKDGTTRIGDKRFQQWHLKPPPQAKYADESSRQKVSVFIDEDTEEITTTVEKVSYDAASDEPGGG